MPKLRNFFSIFNSILAGAIRMDLRFADKCNLKIYKNCQNWTIHFSSENQKSIKMSLNFSTNDNLAIETTIEVENKVTKLSDIWTSNDLNRCIKFIREKFLNRICLQFSDDILSFAVEIEEQLKKHVDSNIFILADTSYGSCCVDEVNYQEPSSAQIFS